MDKESSEISRVLQHICKFDVSAFDDAFLERTAEKRFQTVKAKDFSDYARYLSANADEAAALQDALHVTHTEFFRSPLVFAHLEQWILPRLMEKAENRELRIWSAGCSTGRKAYSIAMLLESINANQPKKSRYRIFATDISQPALAAAEKGTYFERDIQNIKIKDLRAFFVKTGETYTVCDRIKQHVQFSAYDLLDNLSSCPQESIFGNFDLVVCCNVLIYYKPMHQRNILKKLINCMAEHGTLITSEAESQIAAKFSDLHQIVPPSPIFRKREV